MAKDAATLSTADLERILEERKVKVQELAKQRDGLLKQIEDLDAEIANLVGSGSLVSRGRGRRRRMFKNSGSLYTFVVEALGKSKKGLTLPEIVTKVQEAGYRSNSRNFRNVVYQCLYNSGGIAHDSSTGLYSLEK